MAMTIGGLAVAALLVLVSMFTRKTWLAKFTVGGVVVWFALYTVLLLGTSLLSEETTLSQNEPKEFCGFYLDCHMHTAVSSVQRTKTIGGRIAKGEFNIVTVNVFSDAVRVNLGLHAVDAHVVDAAGTEYTRDEQAESNLPPQPAFETKIGPEESFEKQIVFDLPVDAKRPRLDISEGIWVDRVIETFVIGDEDSIFHKRNYFRLEEQ